MTGRAVGRGFVVVTSGLFLTGLSSLQERFGILGSSTDAVAGFLQGLAAVAFFVAIPLFIRGSRNARPPS